MKDPRPGSYELVLDEAERLDGKLTALVPDGPTIVLRGGTIIDGKGGRIARGSVVVKGDRIVSVGAEPATLPPDAEIRDVSGLTVLPGLMDAHIHPNGTASTDPYRSHLAPSEEVQIIRGALEIGQVLASGVTTIRALGHGPADHVYAYRQAILEGLIRGPRILTSGWALSQTRGHGDVPELPWEWVEHARPRATFCDGPVECRVAARRNFGEGANLIKVYSSDNRTGRPDFTIPELAAVTDEAHRRGAKVATHAKTYEGVMNALHAGIDTIEHGPAEVYPDLLELMLEKGAYLVPTLATVHRVGIEGKDWGASAKAMERSKRELEGRQKVVALAAAMGIPVVTGSDSGSRAGFGLLSTRELELLVQCGLSPMDAIVAATGTAAAALGLAADVGTIEVGKVADLIVVDGDPLSEIDLFQDRSRLKFVLQSGDPLIY